MLNSNKHSNTCNTKACDSMIKYLLAILICIEIFILWCILYILVNPSFRQVTFNITNQY